MSIRVVRDVFSELWFRGSVWCRWISPSCREFIERGSQGVSRLGGFVGVVSIHGVPDVFCGFRFRFRMSVVGAGRFS